MDNYQQYIHLSKYARWNGERRETWEETVNRYINYFFSKSNVKSLPKDELKNAILNLEVMPSMRALMTAGPALERDNVSGYNCAYVAVDGQRVFDETMYVLLCGTGVGFSVERQYVGKLPEIAEDFHETDTTIIVADSKIGWAKAYRELLSMLYNGQIPKWDVSRVRPAGSRLKTFGGRASGPDPLVDLFQFSIEVFKNAKGRKLASVECLDLMCKIADIVFVGGVRRAALLSLSNLSDDRMRHAKSGQWWIANGHRALANNSVCYTEKPDMLAFLREWTALIESGSGERGIFFRWAVERLIPDRRKEYGYLDYGCNPCSEIILRSKQFCNLTEVVVRSGDTFDDLLKKVENATILGTMQQANLTNFRYLSSTWKKNTEEEALLGVSLTGIEDHPVMSNTGTQSGFEQFENLGDILEELKKHAINTNKKWADEFGINHASAITCIKPSGTVSQLVDSSSGIHPRYSPFYIRTIRADKKDPLAQMMVEQGYPVEDDVTKPDTGLVFSFPVKSPEGSITVDQISPIDQLELWKTYQLHWCEHKPSITVYVKPHEWMEVGAWVYKNFDIMSGVSFLGYSDHTHRQPPYREITEEEYLAAVEKMPESKWEELVDYEKDDATVSSHELACSGSSCEFG